jgi:hypothetical protein
MPACRPLRPHHRHHDRTVHPPSGTPHAMPRRHRRRPLTSHRLWLPSYSRVHCHRRHCPPSPNFATSWSAWPATASSFQGTPRQRKRKIQVRPVTTSSPPSIRQVSSSFPSPSTTSVALVTSSIASFSTVSPGRIPSHPNRLPPPTLPTLQPLPHVLSPAPPHLASFTAPIPLGNNDHPRASAPPTSRTLPPSGVSKP